MYSIQQQLNKIGPQGSFKRLEAISSMNLGERSKAAQRVIKKRLNRVDMMIKHGLSIEQVLKLERD